MKKTFYKYFVLFVFTGLLSCTASSKKKKDVIVDEVSTISNEIKEEVVSDAKEWLGLIDEGNYARSWDYAASFFQKAVTKEQWTQQLKSIMPSLRKVIIREMVSSRYYTSLPGAPDGEYIVIQFKTSFENTTEKIETVTYMKDDDTWKASGYYIK